jgi:hypothetical protein
VPVGSVTHGLDVVDAPVGCVLLGRCAAPGQGLARFFPGSLSCPHTDAMDGFVGMTVQTKTVKSVAASSVKPTSRGGGPPGVPRSAHEQSPHSPPTGW